jgi:tRNA pseudouridine38-40 synthase
MLREGSSNYLIFLIILLLSQLYISVQGNPSRESATRRYVAQISYDGSSFAGWQSQSNKRSAQQTLNEILSAFYKSDVKVCGASRTDKGVHARGQMIHFDLPVMFESENSRTSMNLLNNLLPDDLKVSSLTHAPEGLLDIQIAEGLPWHAVENAISKHYSFTFSTSVFKDPMKTRYCSNLYDHKALQPIDVATFQDALDLFKGTHDFRAFGNRLDIRAKRSEEFSGKIFSSMRTIYNATIIEMPKLDSDRIFPSKLSLSEDMQDETYYRVDIVLNGALYKMLRNVIAGCAEVAYGTMSLLELELLLIDAPHRADNRLVTAPACGLYLEKVNYREKLDFL